MTEITRRASLIVGDLERFLAGGRPEYPQIAAVHGWPDVAKVRENIAALKPLGNKTVTFDIPSKEPAVTLPTPAPAPAPPRQPMAGQITTPDTLANLLTAAHQHDKPAIRKQAERVDAALAKLRADIKADQQDAAKRKEIAALRARLAELEGKPTRKPTVARGEFPCPVDDCGAVFDTKQGVTMHNTRVHREAGDTR